MKYSLDDRDLIGRGVSYILARTEGIQVPQIAISKKFQNRQIFKGAVLNKCKVWFGMLLFSFWVKNVIIKQQNYIKDKVILLHL